MKGWSLPLLWASDLETPPLPVPPHGQGPSVKEGRAAFALTDLFVCSHLFQFFFCTRHAYFTGIHQFKKAHPAQISVTKTQSLDPIPPVAKDIASEAWLLCFDEFQVRVNHAWNQTNRGNKVGSKKAKKKKKEKRYAVVLPWSMFSQPWNDGISSCGCHWVVCISLFSCRWLTLQTRWYFVVSFHICGEMALFALLLPTGDLTVKTVFFLLFETRWWKRRTSVWMCLNVSLFTFRFVQERAATNQLPAIHSTCESKFWFNQFPLAWFSFGLSRWSTDARFFAGKMQSNLLRFWCRLQKDDNANWRKTLFLVSTESLDGSIERKNRGTVWNVFSRHLVYFLFSGHHRVILMQRWTKFLTT